MARFVDLSSVLRMLGTVSAFGVRFRGGWVGRPYDNAFRLTRVVSDAPLSLELGEGWRLDFSGDVSFSLLDDDVIRATSEASYSMTNLLTDEVVKEEAAGFVEFLPIFTKSEVPGGGGLVRDASPAWETDRGPDVAAFVSGRECVVSVVEADDPWVVIAGQGGEWSLTLMADWLVQFDDDLVVTRTGYRSDRSQMRPVIGLRLESVEERDGLTRFIFDHAVIDVDRSPARVGWVFRSMTLLSSG